MPRTLRHAGTVGVPVWVKVEGNVVMMAEAQSAGSFDLRFTAEFAAEGDRLTGRFRTVTKDYRNTLAPIRMSLVRQP